MSRNNNKKTHTAAQGLYLGQWIGANGLVIVREQTQESASREGEGGSYRNPSEPKNVDVIEKVD